MLTCFYVVAVYPRPLMLQPSLPTYVSSFASPRAATATTSIVPSIPSSAVLGSPVPANVLWSPRSTSVGLVASSQDGAVSQLYSRGSQTSSEMYGGQSRSTLRPVLTSSPSVISSPSGSRVSPTSLKDLMSLVTSLPADVVKSLLETDSNEQSVNMLTESLSTVHHGNIDCAGVDGIQKLCNSAQLAGMDKQVFASPVSESRRTIESISRWRSQPELLQQNDPMQNGSGTFSGRHDYSPSDVDVAAASCENVVRSLGQLGHTPTSLSSLYWYDEFTGWLI